MPYTLAKWAIWLIAAALVGGIVGWLLHGLRRPEEAAEPTDTAEIARLRTRVADLEPAAVERERLRAELAECRAAVAVRKVATSGAASSGAASSGATSSGATSSGAASLATASSLAAVTAATADPDVVAERDRLAALVGDHEATIGDLRARLWNHEAKIGQLQGLVDQARAATAPPAPDLVAGAAVLGEKVRFNDLTVVEGIGPKIAELCHNKGIKTWWALHGTDVATLQALLAEAGPRFQLHDPSSWPQQAGLLAEGQWQAFKTLADQLKGGKVTE